MEGVVALLIPIVAVSGFFSWVIGLPPVGKAFAGRVRGRTRPPAGLRGTEGLGGEWTDAPAEGAAAERRVAALEERVAALDGQVAEVAERLDFAERLLAERRERKLGAGQ